MSLEDQIRRLGDTRAAEVTTPSWRDGSRRGRAGWLLAAVAAVVLAMVGAVIVLTDDDAPDVDTADSGSTTTPLHTTTSTAGSTSSTTTDAPTTQGPLPAGPCATNPQPEQDVLDRAVHLGPDRTPLDLDLDGVDDELLTYDDAQGTWWLIARLRSGWTTPVDIGRPSTPGVAMTPTGVPAGTDLDGDGALEFFVTGYPAGTAGMVRLEQCTLIDEYLVGSPPGGPGASFGVSIGRPAAESCGTLCFVRVRCRDSILVQEALVDSADAVDANWTWTTTEVRLIDGAIHTTEFPVTTGSPLTGPIPRDAPSVESTGVIDCVPPTS